MSFIRMQVRLEGGEEALAAIDAMPAQVARGEARAVRKTTQWAASQAARLLARAHRLPLRAVRKKGNPGNRVVQRVGRHGATSNLRVGMVSSQASGLVWIGLNPIKAAYIGTPRQQRRGARAGRHFFERAFVVAMRNGHTGIFKRYARTSLPIQEQMVRLDQGERVAEQVQARIPQRLSTVLAQELNYEMNVRGRR